MVKQTRKRDWAMEGKGKGGAAKKKGGTMLARQKEDSTSRRSLKKTGAQGEAIWKNGGASLLITRGKKGIGECPSDSLFSRALTSDQR